MIALNFRGPAIIMGFNNLPATRFEDGKHVLRIARERVQERLNFLAGLSGASLLWPSRALAQVCSPTSSDVLGPFYTPGAPGRALLATPDEPAADCQIILRGRKA